MGELTAKMNESACTDLQTDAVTLQQRVLLVVCMLEFLCFTIFRYKYLRDVDVFGVATCA